MRSSEARKKFKLADELYRDKKYTEALTVLDKLDAEFPNAKNVMYPRAMCLAKLGRVRESHEICQKLKAIYNDPRADKLMQKLGAAAPQAPPPLINPNAPDGELAFNPLDLNDIGPVPGTEGGDPMGLGELFAPKPGEAPPPAIDTGPNRKPLYIGLGVAGGILLLGLLCLPLFVGGGTRSSGTAQSTQPTNAAPASDTQQIYWFTSLETATNSASDKYAPTLLFFYNEDSADAKQMMDDTWNQPSIVQLVKGWTCVKINTEEDPDTTEYYEVTKIPTTIVEEEGKGPIYQKTGYVSAQDFYNAIQPLDLKVLEAPDFRDVGIGRWALIAILAVLQSAIGMYLTLLLVRKLPNDEFLKDIISAGLVGVGANFLLGACPCVGVIAVYFILRSVYEFEFLDYIAYLGVSTVIGALNSVLIAAILGIPVEQLIGLL